MNLAWNAELRAARESRGLSREELADLADLSFDSLRSYELGRRRPTRAHLSRLLKHLKLDAPARNRILVDAGFASDAPLERFPEPNIPMKEAVRLVRDRPWPAFLLNRRAEVLAISGPAERLLGVSDEGLQLFGRRRSILTATTRRVLASHVENWSDAVPGMIALFKSAVPEEPSLDAPGPYLKAVLNQVTAGDPVLIARFTKLWETTPPFRGRMTGLVYPTTWNTAAGKIRLRCLVNCLNTDVGLYSHNFMPSDAASHHLLEKLLAD